MFAPGFGISKFYAEGNQSGAFFVKNSGDLTRVLEILLLFPPTKRITDGHAIPLDIGRTELVVVAYKVDVGFGTDKEVARHIVAKASAKVPHEVVIGDVILAIATAARGNVEVEVLSSDPRLQFRAEVFGNTWHPDSIEVIKERAEGHRYAQARYLVLVFAPTPGKLRAHSKIVSQKKIRAEIRG